MNSVRMILSFAAMTGLMIADAAQAVDTCKVKVDKKTGVIQVSATGVGGPLSWGSETGQATTPFFNAGTCVDGDKAGKCELADPTTLAAKTPPDACTLFVDDGVAECAVWISGCTPRRGPGITGYQIVTGAVVFAPGTYTAVANCPAGKKAVGGGGTQGTFAYYIDDSRPLGDGSGWEVQYSPDMNLVAPMGIGEAWAVCADIAE